jgi:hypothetical protein
VPTIFRRPVQAKTDKTDNSALYLLNTMRSLYRYPAAALSFEDAATIHGASITHIAVAKQIFARRSKYFQLDALLGDLGVRAGDSEAGQQAHGDKGNSNNVTQFRHLPYPLGFQWRLIRRAP